MTSGTVPYQKFSVSVLFSVGLRLGYPSCLMPLIWGAFFTGEFGPSSGL